MEAVLFDADGVVQHSTAWDRPPATALGEEFWHEIFTLEAPLLRGEGDLPTLVRDVLCRRGSGVPLADVIGVWSDLSVDRAVLGLIRDLPLPCYLATNQQHVRAAYMRSTLGYDEVFDDQFYSCEMGHMKPEPEYFQAVLAMVDRPAGELLLIDDSQANVAAAVECGLIAELHDPAAGADGIRAILHRHGLQLLQ